MTLQPIDRYASLLDGSIIFSDILVVPQALGLEVIMVPGKGPVFPEPLVTPDDLARLHDHVDVDTVLGYVYEAITLTRHELKGRVPLFGFAGAPWTVMAYCIEGGGSKTLSKAKSWLFKYPVESHKLLQKITDVTITYLKGQARAGAQILQVFDSWAGELSPHHFAEFALPYMLQIAVSLKSSFPDLLLVVFAKGANTPASLTALAESLYDVIGVDYTVDLSIAYDIIHIKHGKTIQGNLDPSLLYADRVTIRKETKRMFETLKWKDGKKGWIANMGHGMYPDHDPEHLKYYLEAVKDFSAATS